MWDPKINSVKNRIICDLRKGGGLVGLLGLWATFRHYQCLFCRLTIAFIT